MLYAIPAAMTCALKLIPSRSCIRHFLDRVNLQRTILQHHRTPIPPRDQTQIAQLQITMSQVQPSNNNNSPENLASRTASRQVIILGPPE